jgi:hypothetical protein
MMQTPSVQNLPVSVEKPAGMDYNRFVYILLPLGCCRPAAVLPFYHSTKCVVWTGFAGHPHENQFSE